MTLDEFFDGHREARHLYDAVAEAVSGIGSVTVRVSKSQVAFRRRSGFAFVWRPGMYLRKAAPLVLSVALRRRDDSPRWKEVVEPAPGRFTHHLELRSEADVDEEVRGWLQEAWELAA